MAPPAPQPGSRHTPTAASALEQVEDALESLGRVVKPRLRGWIHAGTFPLAVAVGVVLTAFSPSGAGRIACAVFGLTAALLFGTSAVYHLGSWSVRTTAVLRRADHANIFLIIAGTYTPLAVLLLPRGQATVLLGIVWSGAVLGLAARLIWLRAPRWVYVPVYVALGWVAVAYLPRFWRAGEGTGPAVTWLIVAGGLAYTIGAVVYATRRPDPRPRWFGFHEVFHVLTVVGFACHATAVSLAALS